MPRRSINLGMKPIKIPQKFFSVMTSRLGRDKAKTRRPSKKKDEFFLKIYVVLRRIWPPRFKVCNFANFFPHFLSKSWGNFKKKTRQNILIWQCGWLNNYCLQHSKKAPPKLEAKLWFFTFSKKWEQNYQIRNLCHY